jgi:uroporphyrinogen decarboxylase
MSLIVEGLKKYGVSEEYAKGLIGTPGSKVPILLLAGGYSVNEYFKKTGISAKEIVSNANHLIKSQIDIHYRFKVELLSCLVDLNIISESFGAKLYYEKEVLPMPNEPAIDTLSAVDELEVTDPKKDGRMPVILDCAKLYRKKYYNKGFVYSGVIEGPITAASNIVGIENLMRGMKKSPSLVHKLLEKVSEVCIEFGNAQIENGLDSVGIAEPTASSTVISPEFFKEFCVPYLKRINLKLNTMGVFIHICGYTQPIIEQWIKIPKTFIISVDDVDLKKIFETIGKKFMVVAGNVSTTSLLRGSPQEVEKITKDCLSKVGENGKYIASPACDLAPGTPENNINAFINTCKKYGKYPINL